MFKRPRRNRKTAAIRSLVAETLLTPADFIVPLFLISGTQRKIPIANMPGIYQMSVDCALKEAERLHKAGIPAVNLFAVVPPEWKDPVGSMALYPHNVITEAIQTFKREVPSLCVITDVALDPYTSHGHDGVIDEKGEVLNDPTLQILAQMALLHAQAGADMVAPSDMMDGRVWAIRQLLDAHQCQNTGIISYTAKYVSNLYTPFRDTLQSHVQIGDKRGYQLNPANAREALLEAALDTEEGADMLMVKPALFYLDIIAKMRAASHLPICAFHVSGEYAMVMAAHEKGICDAQKVFLEALLSIKRAGADCIFTYAVDHVLDAL